MTWRALLLLWPAVLVGACKNYLPPAVWSVVWPGELVFSVFRRNGGAASYLDSTAILTRHAPVCRATYAPCCVVWRGGVPRFGDGIQPTTQPGSVSYGPDFMRCANSIWQRCIFPGRACVLIECAMAWPCIGGGSGQLGDPRLLDGVAAIHALRSFCVRGRYQRSCADELSLGWRKLRG
jgi:hypothetical protein